jgi:3D-(3,5/4)-trihydroxycyclohexane-1,2-dione acylhydrolase (decyclizing)
VVVDSHGYRSIDSLAESMGARNHFQELRRRDKATGRLDGPVLEVDFVAHAASMGAAATRVTSLDELRDDLTVARSNQQTTVIVVEVAAEPRVPGYGWWDVPVAEVSESETVRSARKEYELQVVNERRR